MAAEYQLHLKPPPATELLKSLALAIQASLADQKIKVNIKTNLPQVSKSKETAGAEMNFDEGDNNICDFFVHHPQIEVSEITVSWTQQLGDKRGQRNEDLSFNYSRGEIAGTAYFALDQLKRGDANVTLAVSDSLHRNFTLTTFADISFEAIPQPMRDSVRAQQTALQQLSAEVARIGQFALEQTKANAEHVAELTANLEKTHQDRQAALDEQYEKKSQALADNFENRNKGLLDREEKLRNEKAELDLRANTAVRRDLSVKFREHLEENKEAKLSPSVARKRWPVHAVCVPVLLLSGVAVGLILYDILFREESVMWSHLGPSIFFGGLFASTLWFYVRWNDQWFREHANAEMSGLKLKGDILRANWVAELVFEYKDKDLPVGMLEQFCTDLFRDSKGELTRHPYDAMEDFLRHVTRVKVGSQSVEVEKKSGRIRKQSTD